jgi:hypothetical protein
MRVLLGALGALCVALTGCTATKPSAQALTPELAGSDPGAQMDFWHVLPQRRVTSNDEAFHALLLFAEGQDPAADYDGRVQALKSRNMLPDGFDAPAAAPVNRGTFAVAVAEVLDIKGGVTMRLLGPRPRYALRELQYMGLFPPSSPNQVLTGPECLGIIGRAEDYQRLNGIDDPLEAAPVAGGGDGDAPDGANLPEAE